MSDFLFAQPSILSGAARVMDIGGIFDDYNESATPTEADALAMAADWLAVGGDMTDAMHTVGATVRESIGEPA